MQDTLRALLALQELDEDLFRVRHELRRLPAERELRQAELKRLEARRDDVKKRGMELRVRIKEIEDHTVQQRQRVRKIENEANKAQRDMALLAAYQHEMRTLKRDIGTAEEEGLELVEQVEQSDAELARLDAQLGEEREAFEELCRNVEREMAAAEARRRELETERRRRLGSEVRPETLALYERLLNAREGKAIAELDGRICQACYMEVPTNVYVRVARGADIVQCPSCDRILRPRQA